MMGEKTWGLKLACLGGSILLLREYEAFDSFIFVGNDLVGNGDRVGIW